MSFAGNLIEMDNRKQDFNSYLARQLDIENNDALLPEVGSQEDVEKIVDKDSKVSRGKERPVTNTIQSKAQNIKRTSKLNVKEVKSKSPSKEYSLEQKINYIDGLYPFVYAAAKETGLSLELMLAQGALETGWGETVLPETNNMFNIKADPLWKGKVYELKKALEYENGKKIYVPALFRAYDNIEESVKDRLKFLSVNSRYSAVFKDDVKGNIQKEALALEKARYATASGYATNLIEVAKGRTMRMALQYARKHYGY